MVSGMENGEIEIGDGRVVQAADVVDGRGEVFGRKCGETREAAVEIFVIPASDVRAGAEFGRDRLVIVAEDVGDDGIEEPHFGAGNVLGEVEGSHGLGVGSVVTLIGRNNGENFSGDGLLRFEAREQEIEKKFGLLRLHG